MLEVTVPSLQSAAMEIDVEAAIGKLVAYCRANDWAGYDPYDALNSPLFRTLPFLDSRFPRLVLTQALKRSPINFRPLLRIPKTQNPKAIALFLSAFVRLERFGAACQKGDIDLMIERLCDLRSPGTDYCCWGYSFPWQTRSLLVSASAPNLVCTCFVANALLDAYEYSQDSHLLGMAVSAADYLLNELLWCEPEGATGFSYPTPLSHGHVHNANFLAAALLCRVHRHTGDKRYLAPALRVARHSVAFQHPDGSWYYGEHPTQHWIDNFHTGYNLCALLAIDRHTRSDEFDCAIRAGHEFYRSHFFLGDGAVRYFHDRKYPIDIHSVAQSIITLLSCRGLDPRNVQLTRFVFRWAMNHMWDERGFYHYRVLPLYTIRSSYIRWSQAWMLLALAMMMEFSEKEHATGYAI